LWNEQWSSRRRGVISLGTAVCSRALPLERVPIITLFAQPFVSVGRYSRLGELAAAGSDQVHWYDATAHAHANRAITDGANGFSIAEPDFTVMSLRSTAVLRWEPTPGTTLYVVWQQSRAGSDTFAQPLHAATPGVITAPGTHTLAIKLAYWFG
jgi:hypothetical protein